jgi:hypothetical protein
MIVSYEMQARSTPQNFLSKRVKPKNFTTRDPIHKTLLLKSTSPLYSSFFFFPFPPAPFLHKPLQAPLKHHPFFLSFCAVVFAGAT